MFQKIRLRLTLLSGGITTLILIIMTLGYLYTSEKNLMQNRIFSWQSDVSSIAFNLEQQTVITHTWLANLEAGGNYYVSILDNNTPFLFNDRMNDTAFHDLVTDAWAYYYENGGALPENTISYRSRYKTFLLKKEQSYYCFVITLDKENVSENSTLKLLLIAPLRNIQHQIFQQRLVFMGIIFMALAAIWLFSWFFTGKLLFPIEENRKKQNQFVAAASHELRTPLAVILSCTEAMLEKPDIEPFAHDLSTVKSEALRMSSLIQDLLTLSSRDANHFPIQKASTELDTLLLDAYEAFEAMAHTKQLKISVTLPEDIIPPCNCDKQRIYQVIAILLHNAISYTPNGGKITLALTMQEKYFALSISDTGVGIPDEEKEKIFDRFYRSEKSRSTKGHFGLGLSIAYEIVAAHHGTIRVYDNESGGATFAVKLPICYTKRRKD